MFVWNHFTNDARVLRECMALSESGYSVDLICIHDPKQENLPRYEKRGEHFEIFRVRRYPVLLEILQHVYNFCLKHKAAGLLALITWACVLYILPFPAVLLTILFLLLVKTKAKTLWIRSAIFLRMIGKGWHGNYDIYHSNDLNTLPQGWFCSKLRICKRRLIYDSHEVQTSRTGYDHSVYGRLEALLINMADEMIVENHTRARYNQKVYGFYPHVVHNYPFITPQNIHPSFAIHEVLGIAAEEKILLYQGGIQTGRGLDKLIEASAKFKEGVLVFIGDGKIKTELQDEVKKRNLTDRIKFLSKVPLAVLPQYTQQAYLGFQVLNNVCFNHYSASSNKLFEYMMSGIPVIACRFPEIKRVIENEQIGICIDSHRPEEIAKAVNRLLADENLRNAYSLNALKAREKYNWDREKIQFLNVYQKLMQVKEGLGWKRIWIR
ncbi:glycosyltransferase [Cytobacillus sp.]|uniref:glycosyltransferase n=1 Tax=Cytobacillus sp. TaxID=2675269 RepID=UPI003510EA24